jgi:hypothetical protein
MQGVSKSGTRTQGLNPPQAVVHDQVIRNDKQIKIQNKNTKYIF